MPYSSDEGKAMIRRWITDMQPATVLDIGVGAGAYGYMVGNVVPHARIDAVEIHEPYVSTFGLRELYNEIVIGDIRDPQTRMRLPLPKYDLIIMGDVLEHMTADEAEQVWCAMLPLSKKACIASIPIIEYPQGAVFGNEHEAHLHTWDAQQVLKSLPEITEWWLGHEVGVFKATTENMRVYPLPVGVWR